jgi:hypothetical protein
LPITTSAKAVVESAIGIVEAARQLAAHPQDPAAHQKYSMQSRGLSEAIKNTILTIRQAFQPNLVMPRSAAAWWQMENLRECILLNYECGHSFHYGYRLKTTETNLFDMRKITLSERLCFSSFAHRKKRISKVCSMTIRTFTS